MFTHLVVMGVSGCGKSTIAQALATRLRWPLGEGDDFHSAANVAKMAADTPLTDEDRWPWLDAITAWTAARDAAGESTVLSCSALRRAYRDRLRRAPGQTLFVHLVGTPELLAQRMAGRTGHFMPGDLLASQLETLESLQPDEAGIEVDIDNTTDHIVELVLVWLEPSPSSSG